MNRGLIIKRVQKQESLVLVLVLFFVITIAIIASKGTFLHISNIIKLLNRSSIVGIITIGQVIVIISGGFDLSVGSLVAVCVAFVAVLIKNGSAIAIACIVGVLASVLLGFVNGVVVSKMRVPPFITTLGMMYIARSIAWNVTKGSPIIVYQIYQGIEPWVSWVPRGSALFSIIIWMIILLFSWVFLHHSKYGRYIFAVGGNEKTALLSGVNVDGTKVLVYTFSGLLCGLCGLLYIYRVCGAPPSVGEEYLLESIAAAVIGGTNINGGEGTILGGLVGVIIIETIINFMNIVGLSPRVHQIILGSIVLLAVLVYKLLVYNK